MKVKKYRADTLRQALEQIKGELGEDALILGTKQVQTKGFLGFGAKQQIEVTVTCENPAGAASVPAVKPPAPARPATTGNSFRNRLSITDGAAVLPPPVKTNIETRVTGSGSLMSPNAILTRPTPPAAVAAPKPPPPAPLLEKFMLPTPPPRRAPDLVELADTAPRVVHRPKPAPAPAVAQPTATAVATAPAKAPAEDKASAANNSMLKEFNRLRAELREVKLSLGSLVRQQNTLHNQIWPSQDSLQEHLALYQGEWRNAFLDLTNSGLSAAHAHQIIQDALPFLEAEEGVMPDNLSYYCLSKALPALVNFADDPLVQNAPQVLALLGPTGVGKTTTIAKLAANIGLRQRRPVELITLDTYRIAAVEQLKTYAEIIGIGCHVVRSVLELDGLLSRFAGKSTVLIDTAGRSPNELADQMDLADYLRSHPSYIKMLVLSATMQPVDALMASYKFSIFGADHLVVTKLDETLQPGSMIDWAAEAQLPLLYLCTGQRVPEDLVVASQTSTARQLVRHHVNPFAKATTPDEFAACWLSFAADNVLSRQSAHSSR